MEFGISKLLASRSGGFVTLKIYNLLGKEIATIVNENLNPGNYRYKFDGRNFASGVYIYKITVGDFSAVRRMVLVKKDNQIRITNYDLRVMNFRVLKNP